MSCKSYSKAEASRAAKSKNPRQINGIAVPYNLSIAELATLVETKSSNRWAAFVALGCKLESEALEVLQNKLQSPDWSLRRAAAEAISYHRYGERARSELIRLLHDESPHVVRTACESLGKLKVGSSHDQVLNLLKLEDPATRLVVLRTLCVFWQDSDFDFVLKAMQADSSEDVRKEAAWTLWQCARTSNWKILFAKWQESKLSRERAWACQLAGQHGDDSYTITLQKLANDENQHVREAAQHALQTLSLRKEHSSMFQLFTERAIEVVVLAQEEAIYIGYRCVGTEDFLIGLLREGKVWSRKPEFAGEALKSAGLNLQNARKAAKQFRRLDTGSAEFVRSGDTYVRVIHTEFTEHANQLQLAAKDCARKLGHKQIDTVHLLIGLLTLDDCNGVKILKNLKVDCDRLRETAVNYLNSRGDLD